MLTETLSRALGVILTITSAAGCLNDGISWSGPGAEGEPPPAAERTGYYASPTGSSEGDGSWQSPWDLATALAGAGGRIVPGDTIWVRGGTYQGAFLSELSGTEGAPIVVRALPGERAIIDGRGSTRSTLTIAGPSTVIWGIELTNSDPDRSASSRPTLLYTRAPQTRFINLVVHDGGVGLYTGQLGTGAEVYGSIFYNNGWRGPADPRGNGHGIYAKNGEGTHLIKDNVVFNQFGYGIHAYVGAGRGHLRNIRVEGNISFNNGSVSGNTSSGNANLLLGGEEPVENGEVIENLTYFSPGIGVFNAVIGYDTISNRDVVLRHNLLAGGRRVLTVGAWSEAAVTENVILGSEHVLVLLDSSPAELDWHRNLYFRDPTAEAWVHGMHDLTLAGWQDATQLGFEDRALTDPPTTPRVVVRPNQYERGRAHIAVYNWALDASASVDVSGVLEVGDRYELHNVQDLFGPPAASGTYAASGIVLPLSGVDATPPIGGSPSPPPRTGPEFDVFLLRRVEG